ncbi:hypothetical protein FHX82_006877 [Amycolatopsis bartoniae]|uniref:Chitin-binding type-3 domain-containing protein n=1 Tax=Amycolatopsis bartoniae TaxID=941986 RepID=A0A8H9IVS9_9PSEU|nr:hypothetical protein [Amycolatopsis bartoniae]MBB2939791.1 hypothetical protein [Amycolatopsis bartoniae]TVT07499.1 hypothetical protein FNH07_16220 [Amycolatopsis bartoniae]GHF54526.1 hypothetical protein GCM10017566_30040 [Amycolatopsis bartoniae]
MKRLLARAGIAGAVAAAAIGLVPATASASGWVDDSWWTEEGLCEVRGDYHVNEGDWYTYECTYHGDHEPSPWLLSGFYK